MVFKDRTDAGRHLAAALTEYAGRQDVIVLALPRGGVPVAAEIAKALAAPLDLCLVRKLGVPGYAELAMGAIASGGVQVLSRDLIRDLKISDTMVEEVAAAEREELDRRDKEYRGAPSTAAGARTHGDSRRRRAGDRVHHGSGRPGDAAAGARAHRRRGARGIARGGDARGPRRGPCRVPRGATRVPGGGPVVSRLWPDLRRGCRGPVGGSRSSDGRAGPGCRAPRRPGSHRASHPGAVRCARPV